MPDLAPVDQIVRTVVGPQNPLGLHILKGNGNGWLGYFNGDVLPGPGTAYGTTVATFTLNGALTGRVFLANLIGQDMLAVPGTEDTIVRFTTGGLTISVTVAGNTISLTSSDTLVVRFNSSAVPVQAWKLPADLGDAETWSVGPTGYVVVGGNNGRVSVFNSLTGAQVSTSIIGGFDPNDDLHVVMDADGIVTAVVRPFVASTTYTSGPLSVPATSGDRVVLRGGAPHSAVYATAASDGTTYAGMGGAGSTLACSMYDGSTAIFTTGTTPYIINVSTSGTFTTSAVPSDLTFYIGAARRMFDAGNGTVAVFFTSASGNAGVYSITPVAPYTAASGYLIVSASTGVVRRAAGVYVGDAVDLSPVNLAPRGSASFAGPNARVRIGLSLGVQGSPPVAAYVKGSDSLIEATNYTTLASMASYAFSGTSAGSGWTVGSLSIA